jgi:hypothetical protein
MTTQVTSFGTAKRNQLVVIAAGAITVTAIVLSFASGYLGLKWQWLRPAAELLLLAELVGLIVLERHQLFEPVHEGVDTMRVDITALRKELRQLSERFDVSGQTTFYANPSQTVAAVVRALREALAREQEAPQMLRIARLARNPLLFSDRELGAEFRQYADAVTAFHLLPASIRDSRVRVWSVRVIITVTGLEDFERWREQVLPAYWGQKPLNQELKVRVRIRSSAEALLTPQLTTDRDAIVTLDDDNASYRWGILFQGRQYVTVFARWFDELWASIPDRYVVGSRAGLNEKALDRIRMEVEAADAASDRPEIPKGETAR